MGNVTKDKQLTSPADRLKYIRAILRVSRGYLQEKYGVPEVSLKSWENGTTKLSLSAVKRCVEMYRTEGLIVNEDWIVNGVGLDPVTTASVNQYFTNLTNENSIYEDDEVCMIREADSFKKMYNNAVIMIVTSDEMQPFYKAGDYVGGKLRYGDDINHCLNKNNIVLLKDGSKFFRRLIRSATGKYNLTCLNPSTTTAEPVLYDVEIIGVAPVIWHRCKDD